MNRLFRTFVVCTMFLMFVTGCKSLTGETMGQNIDDTNLTATVKAKLTADKASNLTRVEVNTTNSVVYLTGIVDTAAQRDRAQEIASKVDGVKKVVNNLQVQKK
jgi:hyperosmotically inducible periplasmic protein